MFQNPYKEHFYHWFLNIIEQNRDQQSFPKMLSRLPEVIEHFFVKQWHETPTQDQVREEQRKSIRSLLLYLLRFRSLLSSN